MRFTDPSGHCTEEDKKCVGKIREIENAYGVDIDDENGLWTIAGLNAIKKGMRDMRLIMGKTRFTEEFSEVTFSVDSKTKGGMWTTGNKDIHIGVDTIRKSAKDPSYVTRETVHELAHIWDDNCNDCYSQGMMAATGSEDINGSDKPGNFLPGGFPPTEYAAEHNGREDWAESVTGYVYRDYVTNPNWDRARIEFVHDALVVIGERPH